MRMSRPGYPEGKETAVPAEAPRWVCTIPQEFFPAPVQDQLATIPGRMAWDGPSPMPHADLRRLLGEVDGVLVWPLDRLEAEDLAAAPRLRVISTVGTGLDHVDLAAATARGILVCHTPGLNVEAVADHTWALLLAVARRIGEQGSLLRDGQFLEVHRRPVFGRSLAGATFGLIGLGAIGEAVARRAHGFGMQLLYTSRTRKPDLEAELGL